MLPFLASLQQFADKPSIEPGCRLSTSKSIGQHEQNWPAGEAVRSYPSFGADGELLQATQVESKGPSA
jgi:hypothetical protein